MDAATVSGGGASAVSAAQRLTFGGEPVFGVQGFEIAPEEEGGALDTQAGSHPFQLTRTLYLDQPGKETPPSREGLAVRLPPAWLEIRRRARCTAAQFLHRIPPGFENECRPETEVGIATVSYKLSGQVEIVSTPVFNLEPEQGEPARFGFDVAPASVVLDTSVRTGDDYGVTVSTHNISQVAGFLSSQVTFWGAPGDPRHDNVRGWACFEATRKGQTCQGQAERTPPPFLSLPTSCTGNPLQSSVEVDSWQRPGNFQSLALTSPLPTLDGCNRLPFEPSVVVTPDGRAASTPTGLNIDVHVNQDSILNPTGLAESAVKDISVTLPEGVAVNPAGGDGLQGCSEALAGFHGFAELETVPNTSTALFTPALPEPLEPGLNFCANASKIGEFTARSPLLPPTQPVKGFVYLTSQNQNPFGSLIALYLVARDPISGFVLRRSGKPISQNPARLQGRSRTIRSWRSKTLNCISLAANAPLSRVPPAVAPTRRSRASRPGRPNVAKHPTRLPARLTSLRARTGLRAQVRACRSIRRSQAARLTFRRENSPL